MSSKKSKIRKWVIIIGFALVLISYSTGIGRIDRFGMSSIRWVDCIKINNTKYYGYPAKTNVDPSLIDKRIGKVKFNVSKMVHNSRYRFRNGDATWLEVGTEIYSVRSTEDAIAVKVGEDYFLYKPMQR